MFHNNIAENRSTRVLERPGGRQSINLFGGDDTPEPTRTGRRAVQPQQPASAANTPAAGSVRNIPDNHNIFGADTTNIKAAEDKTATTAAAGARVTNNIWGSDSEVAKPSTRVLAGPGGGSSGVSGIFGGADAAESKSNSRPGSGPNSARSNQTSSQSPFAVDGETAAPVTGKRGNNAAAQRSAGNIISWQ